MIQCHALEPISHQGTVTLSDSCTSCYSRAACFCSIWGPCASSVLRQARVVAVYYVMLCYVMPSVLIVAATAITAVATPRQLVCTEAAVQTSI